jgi:3-oxoacyl-[acyl-carrier protein] reductase
MPIIMDAELKNRVVLITGASGGIGGEIVRAFHAEGARVVAHYGSQPRVAQELARELADNCTALGADLTNESEVASLFARATSLWGPVEILIANAGRWPPEELSVETMSLARWQSTLDANLTTAFLCMREFLKGIRAHQISRPAAVLIGSTAAMVGEAGHADYAAAKAALTYGFVQSLKNELCRLTPRGRVNVICPGWTLTERVAAVTQDAARMRRVLQTIPLRKIARPRDVAMAAVFLASDRLAGHMTGQVLPVSGGMEGRVLYQPEEIDVSGILG